MFAQTHHDIVPFFGEQGSCMILTSERENKNLKGSCLLSPLTLVMWSVFTTSGSCCFSSIHKSEVLTTLCEAALILFGTSSMLIA